LRSCAATGVHAVFTTAATASCWSPKVLRSAQGAHSGLRIYEGGDDVAQWLKRYRQNTERLPIYVTTLQNATDLYQCQLPRHAIWVFGSEGQGVSAELLSQADHLVKIAHSQQFVESLNVGIAAALCLFEQKRQANIV
jgi:TrmH family RNA methyltransferase